MGVGRMAARGLAPVARRMAPEWTSQYVRDVLERAIDGVGPLRGAVRAADAKLVEADGDVEAAIKSLIASHSRMAGVQGFVTNVGGLVTLAVSIPANITGLTLLQCHLVAGIAHLRGYDLSDPRVRNAVLVCMLGEDSVRSLVKSKKIPGGPMLLHASRLVVPRGARAAIDVTAPLPAHWGEWARLVEPEVPASSDLLGTGSATDVDDTTGHAA